MGVGWDNRAVVERSVFIMRMLLSLYPLLLILWNSDSTEALPVQDKPSHTNEILTKDKDLLKMMMTDMAELNLTSKELADLDSDLLNGKLGERSVFGEPVPKDKSPCKLFYWKSFSSC
ncbi:somatostatin-2-like [Xyrauchen texanus]|uniref:somatostatin-2-like n=1 Tax=Xyrauchen texanus TaxID=154827 RepID=UPI002241F3BD|nr:somatostatin-2-like [Xyrauchen texanus]XP_051947923.1 somatostatin-2-like [Xyrauchen texanus]